MTTSLENRENTEKLYRELVRDISEQSRRFAEISRGQVDCLALAGWQEKQTKLWHTVFYESEMKLKQLYIKICCNLPSHGCHVYRVRQLLDERSASKTVKTCFLISTVFSGERMRSVVSVRFYSSF